MRLSGDLVCICVAVSLHLHQVYSDSVELKYCICKYYKLLLIPSEAFLHTSFGTHL